MTSEGKVMRCRSPVLMVFITALLHRVRAANEEHALVPKDIGRRTIPPKHRGRAESGRDAEVGNARRRGRPDCRLRRREESAARGPDAGPRA